MGVKVVVKKEVKNVPKSQDEAIHRLSKFIANYNQREFVAAATDDATLKGLKTQRDEFSKSLTSKTLRKILEIPGEVDARLAKIWGEKWYRNPKLVKKFLDMEVAPGIKGEMFLTVPRNKI